MAHPSSTWRTFTLAFCCFLACVLSFSTALTPSTTYNLFMQPTITDDLGMGTHAMSFNHPYVTFTHYIDPSTLSSTSFRVPFHVEPQIPIDASKQTFTFTVSGTSSDISWGRVIYDWSTSTNDLTLQIDPSLIPSATTSGTSGSTVTEPTTPYTFELSGRVGYVYGPTNVVQYEDRILRVMIYLKFTRSAADRKLTSAFTQMSSSTTTPSVIQYVTTTSGSTTIAPFTLQSLEAFQFNCGTQSNVIDMTQSCTWGPASPPPSTSTTTLSDVIWADESSQITVGSGILRITAPVYTNGYVFVPTATTLIIDPGAGKSVTIMSLNAQPTFVNNGQIIVKSGVLRVIGTSMLGSGNLIVEKAASVEIDAQNSEITFGVESTTAGSANTSPTYSPSNTQLSTQLHFNGNNLFLPVIYSEGTVTFISGRHTFLRSFVFLATSLLQVGSSAKLTLYSPLQNYPKSVFPNYVIGGLFNGNLDQTTFPALNELSLVCGGSITTMPNVSLIIGSTSKFDGLGRLYMGLQSNLTISISFFSPSSTAGSTSTTSSAGVYFNGPQTERPNGDAGFMCVGCNLNIVKGGIISSSGFVVTNPTKKASVGVYQSGYLHFIGQYARNHITANTFDNWGDVLVLNGASVDFNAVVTSYTHIRALDSASTIYLSNKQGVNKFYRPKGTRYSTSASNNGNGSAVSLANNPTHLFALYIPGILIIRDGVTVQLVTDAVGSDLGQQGALFFAGGLYNSGSLYVDVSANLEVYTYTQSIEPDTLTGATPNQFGTNSRQVESLPGTQVIQSSPALILVTPSSQFSQVAYNKYVYNAGIIYDTSASSTTSTGASQPSNINVVYGHVIASNADATTPSQGINAHVTLYTKATMSPGTNIPIQEYITSSGVVLDSTYAVKQLTGGPTTVAYLQKFNKKEYTPSLTKTAVGALTAQESATFDIDVIYNEEDGKIYTDQVVFGTLANSQTLLNKVTINIFTNIKTQAQSISLAADATTTGTTGALHAASTTVSTLSLGAQNTVKYPYRPNESLTHDERTQQYEEIRNDKVFLEKYLPIDTASYDSLLLGRSDPRTHSANTLAATTSVTTTADDNSNDGNSDGSTHNNNTTVPAPTPAPTPSGTQSEYQRFVAPIFQAFDSASGSGSSSSSLLATIKTINIIPISIAPSSLADSSLVGGHVLLDHSYNGKDELLFNVNVSSKQVQLVAYAESKSSAVINKISLSLALLLALLILT
jgi:hypothetical protein